MTKTRPIIPLSPTQDGFWLAEQVRDRRNYNISLNWRLRGKIDVPALKSALRMLVDRHEILRTRFPIQQGQPCQDALSVFAFEPAMIDLSEEPQQLQRRLIAL